MYNQVLPFRDKDIQEPILVLSPDRFGLNGAVRQLDLSLEFAVINL
jgi:hypothetical protein